MSDVLFTVTSYDVPLTRNEQLLTDQRNRALARINSALVLLDRMERYGYPSPAAIATAVRVELTEEPAEGGSDDD